MAGEYGVCSELSKRNFDVHLTMGNTKAVDVYVNTGTSCLKRIEVKTSRSQRIVTGFFQKYYLTATGDKPDYWVLVYIDYNNQSRYFVLTHQEMGDMQMLRNKLTSWPASKVKGVDNVLLRSLIAGGYEDRWEKIK